MYEIKRGGHADMKRIYPMMEHDFHEWERPSLADCHLGLIRGAELLLLKDESGLEAGYAYMLRDAARLAPCGDALGGHSPLPGLDAHPLPA